MIIIHVLNLDLKYENTWDPEDMGTDKMMSYEI